MGIKSALEQYAPRIYRWISRERNIRRLTASIRNGDVDFPSLIDTIKKSRGTYDVECSICGFVGFFRAFGTPPRLNALCPTCGSLERHRQLALALRQKSLSGTLLHFAPEVCVATLLKAQPINYVSADLHSSRVDLHLNIESINLPDGQIDTIVCSHVLEHVDDRLALPELRRILKPCGILIAMVPIVEGWDVTYEDETIISPSQRELHFGQNDHVRVYGADFTQRLEGGGV